MAQSRSWWGGWPSIDIYIYIFFICVCACVCVCFLFYLHFLIFFVWIHGFRFLQQCFSPLENRFSDWNLRQGCSPSSGASQKLAKPMRAIPYLRNSTWGSLTQKKKMHIGRCWKPPPASWLPNDATSALFIFDDAWWSSCAWSSAQTVLNDSWPVNFVNCLLMCADVCWCLLMFAVGVVDLDLRDYEAFQVAYVLVTMLVTVGGIHS